MKIVGRKTTAKLSHVVAYPTEALGALLGGKWKLTIMEHLLADGVIRFNELRRNLPHITQKALTQQPRELERDGFIHRTVYPVVPVKVEYGVTELGKSIEHILQSMKEWGHLYTQVVINEHGFTELSVEDA